MPRAAALIVIAALLSLLLFVRVPGKGLWYDVSLNAVHGPIFAVVAVLLLALVAPARRASAAGWVMAFAIALALGILIEVLQTLGNRPGSLFDVMTDAAGAAAGLALWAVWQGRRQADATAPGARRPHWLPVAVAIAGIAIIAWEPLQAARAYAHRTAVFPSIAEFRGVRDLTFVQTGGAAVAIAELPARWALQAGERALRIAYDAEHSPAVQVLEPSPDWRGYNLLAVDLTNPSDRELRLILRIHDATHDWSHEDRLNLPVTVPPATRTTLRVALEAVRSAPASRPMDLRRIANVMLFGATSDQPAEVYVSRLWLE